MRSRGHAAATSLGASVLLAAAALADEPPQDAARGRELYRTRCAVCHGEDGDGDGPAAPYLDPPPRDLRKGSFKAASAMGEQPYPDDRSLHRVLREGMPGSAMPRFAALPRDDANDLVAFLKSLRPDEEVAPAAPVAEPDGVGPGRARYKELGCHQCHGAEGTGDGPAASDLRDGAGRPVAMPDLRRPRMFRFGSKPEDLSRVLLHGMAGSVMPAYGGAATDEDVARLAAFVRSLSLQPMER